MEIELIHSAGPTKQIARIALEYGFKLGVRHDYTPPYPVEFVDVDYKKPPSFGEQLKVVRALKPKYAIVRDLQQVGYSEEDMERAIQEYKILANYCEYPFIVPKNSMQMAKLPPEYNVAVSLSTKYGSCSYDQETELQGRRLHLLGGSPKGQLLAYRKLRKNNLVGSADGNVSFAMANAWLHVWNYTKWAKWYPRKQTGGGHDQYIPCFKESCRRIICMWQTYFEHGYSFEGSDREFIQHIHAKCVEN